jgi:hypothetical protein
LTSFEQSDGWNDGREVLDGLSEGDLDGAEVNEGVNEGNTLKEGGAVGSFEEDGKDEEEGEKEGHPSTFIAKM